MEIKKNHNTRQVYVFTNKTQVSMDLAHMLKSKLENHGFTLSESFNSHVELIICIGGDGAFLEAVHTFNFPDIPFIGINTGHLGFFQELNEDDIDEFLKLYKEGKYAIQSLSTVKAIATGVSGGEREYKGLNEIVLKSNQLNAIHLDIFIGGSFIERFSGDGILVATPAGSTAYNYSLGGSIVDPRIEILQLTPIAPMNTIAYRSFTSSILLPRDLTLGIVPEPNRENEIGIFVDGIEQNTDIIERVDISFSTERVELLRLEGYDFWTKVKSKFL